MVTREATAPVASSTLLQRSLPVLDDQLGATVAPASRGRQKKFSKCFPAAQITELCMRPNPGRSKSLWDGEVGFIPKGKSKHFLLVMGSLN